MKNDAEVHTSKVEDKPVVTAYMKNKGKILQRVQCYDTLHSAAVKKHLFQQPRMTNVFLEYTFLMKDITGLLALL